MYRKINQVSKMKNNKKEVVENLVSIYAEFGITLDPKKFKIFFGYKTQNFLQYSLEGASIRFMFSPDLYLAGVIRVDNVVVAVKIPRGFDRMEAEEYAENFEFLRAPFFIDKYEKNPPTHPVAIAAFEHFKLIIEREK